MSSPDREDDMEWELLARYVAHECSPAERAAVDAWAASHAEHAAELRALERWWTSAATVPSTARVDAMWTSLSHRMRQQRTTPASPIAPRAAHLHAPTPAFTLGGRRAPSARHGWRRAAGALAASLVFATAGTLAWRARAITPTTAEAPLREFATGRGQRATIRLVDGTRVELGFGSRLRVRSFDGRSREMYLEGEAMFDVVHDARRPFLVHAANAVTEDLGTVFTVRAYPGAPAVRVMVLSGRVALRPRASSGDSAAARGTELGRGQLGTLDSSGRVEVVDGADSASALGWLGDRVVFRNATLGDVAVELGRRFDLDVRVPDSAVAARRVTIDMPAGSIGDVLDAATVPLRLRHRRAGGTIVIER